MIRQKSIYFLFWFIAVTLFLNACNTTQDDSLEEYYYPVEHLQDGLVYVFDVSGMFPDEYWYIKSFMTDDSIILTTTIYDALQRQQQLTREMRCTNGYVQRDLFLFFQEGKQTNRVKVEIVKDDLFPFYPTDSLDVFLYHSTWTENLNQEEVEKRLIRNRRFRGRDTMNVMGQETEVAVFSVIDRMEDEREGTLAIFSTAREYYAKHWGLIAKDQYVGGQHLRSFHLKDTMSMRTFESLYQQKMRQ